MNLRDERFKKYKKSRINFQLSYKEYMQEKRKQERILRERQRQERLFSKNISNLDFARFNKIVFNKQNSKTQMLQ